MRITITIDTDNEAFEGDELGPETSRILANLARRLEGTDRRDIRPEFGITLRDTNGNTVGSVEIDD